MNPIIYDNPSVFLVVSGAAHAAHITSASQRLSGLTFRQQSPHGAIDLAIEAPTDLAAYADLAAASILKPVCLPITLTRTQHGIVHACLRNEREAHHVAQRMLSAIAQHPHTFTTPRLHHSKKEN